MRGISWPKTHATHYQAQLELPDKGRAIKGLVVYNCWDVSVFGPAKHSYSTLSSTIPRGLNLILYFVEQMAAISF